ncbi:hypothetical protein PTH_2015 [Pelotomaculum thermopropionicum SI]|uniref:Uncharacterized protein n=1 Tax=Pelotomaculum thermopropionicum (strain DSM 13744 / JCM 10971 / SI) TaxID=370438 RepID=A5D0M6_PELTS|nr:hypothetical protein PTH_2015 [Pelotomaculum thermopropionicum SI]
MLYFLRIDNPAGPDKADTENEENQDQEEDESPVAECRRDLFNLNVCHFWTSLKIDSVNEQEADTENEENQDQEEDESPAAEPGYSFHFSFHVLASFSSSVQDKN